MSQGFTYLTNIENEPENLGHHIKLCDLIQLSVLRENSFFTTGSYRIGCPLMESSFASAIFPSIIFQMGIRFFSFIFQSISEWGSE